MFVVFLVELAHLIIKCNSDPKYCVGLLHLVLLHFHIQGMLSDGVLAFSFFLQHFGVIYWVLLFNKKKKKRFEDTWIWKNRFEPSWIWKNRFEASWIWKKRFDAFWIWKNRFEPSWIWKTRFEASWIDCADFLCWFGSKYFYILVSIFYYFWNLCWFGSYSDFHFLLFSEFVLYYLTFWFLQSTTLYSSHPKYSNIICSDVYVSSWTTTIFDENPYFEDFLMNPRHLKPVFKNPRDLNRFFFCTQLQIRFLKIQVSSNRFFFFFE